MRPFLLLFTTKMLLLASCEGYIHMQGRIVDRSTKKPIEHVKVFLILRGKDTLVNNKLYYDTIDYQERLVLRKKGIKDDYDIYDDKGFSRFGPSLSDTSGYFRVGNILVGFVGKFQTRQLLFIKNGFQPLSINLDSIVCDSVMVSLQRASGDTRQSKGH